MDKKEQELRKIELTYYYYKTWFNLNEQEKKIQNYEPVVDFGSAEIDSELQMIRSELIECKENYGKAQNKEGLKVLPNKADYRLEWDQKEAKKYQPDDYPDFFFWFLSFWIFAFSGMLLASTLTSMFGQSEEGFSKMMTLAVVVALVIAILFHHWLKQHYYLKKERKKYLPILNSRRESYEKDLKEAEDYNRNLENEIKVNMEKLPNKIEKYKKEDVLLDDYCWTLKEAEKNVHDKLIEKNKKVLQEFIANKNEFLRNTDHFIVPQHHQFNWGYYGGLYEIIETGQATEIPDAIRILEDRYQRAELAFALKQQIKQSEQILSATIDEASQNVVNNLTQAINNQTNVLTSQIQNNTNQLNKVQNIISSSTSNVLSSLDELNSSVDNLDANSTNLSTNLTGLQNEIDKGVNIINKTINKNFENVERYY